jgi:hypothetical protein
MSSNKQQHVGEEYLVEISDDAVEIWRITMRIHKGMDTWGLTLVFHERRSLPLSAEDAQNLAAEFVSDTNPETRRSIIDSLSI